MGYLTPEASATYLEITKRSFMLGVVSQGQLLARLVALRLMCKPNDPALLEAQRILQLDPEYPTDEWSDGGAWAEKSEPANKAEERGKQADDDDVIFRFIPHGNTGLSNWEFHPYDADYFPSVPHGHYQGKPQPKLDAYLGWVYNGVRQVSREPRSKIVALWNDSSFRAVAMAAINYYLTTFPSYSGWRVKNPRALPRRRRP
jgi:hypothetical protein